jgi:stage III sporulation protein AH
MMVLKKKEIIAGALVLLIGVAGYLNWSYQDTVRVTDNDTYVETGKKLGEAQYVNATADNVEDSQQNEQPEAETSSSAAAETKQGDSNYFATAKSEKETARSKSMEILKQTAENESFDADIRKKAQEQILAQSQNVEKETAVENIARAKGYEEISVYIDGDAVDIAVRKAEFSENDAVILKEIATEQLKISSKNIKIVEIK